jgi:hypothetical protein
MTHEEAHLIRMTSFVLGLVLAAAPAVAQQSSLQGAYGQPGNTGSAARQSAPMGSGGLTYDPSADGQKSNISGLSVPNSAASQSAPLNSSGSGYDDGTGTARRNR